MILNPLLTMGKLAKYRSLPLLPFYLKDRISRSTSVQDITDVFIIMVDHYEPSRKMGQAGVEKVREWCKDYESIASNFKDTDGVHPQHTWFYRYDYPNFDCLNIISESVFRGYGEIEFHLHHHNDTSENFKKTIREGIQWFNSCGAMVGASRELPRNFAYIAGNWALDNGRFDDQYSGVNDEIRILSEHNCYADFTFPAFAVNSQPYILNKIYYTNDDGNPKSYRKGIPVKCGRHTQADLMIFQGSFYINWANAYIDYSALESDTPYFENRIQNWVNASLTIDGKPEWLFIKLHTHGMQSSNLFRGEELSTMFSDIEAFCKKQNLKLHYLTAREAYNIVKAAENLESGEPHTLRDYILPKPVNRYVYSDKPYMTEIFDNTVILRFEGCLPGKLLTRGLVLENLHSDEHCVQLNSVKTENIMEIECFPDLS